MPQPREHPYDGIADDLFDWMNEEVAWHTEAMQAGYRTPFSAQTTESQKMDYYRRQMYQSTPDGQIQYDKPNKQGRDQILKQFGVQTYAQIMDQVKPQRGRREPEDLWSPPDLEGEEVTGGEEEE